MVVTDNESGSLCEISRIFRDMGKTPKGYIKNRKIESIKLYAFIYLLTFRVTILTCLGWADADRLAALVAKLTGPRAAKMSAKHPPFFDESADKVETFADVDVMRLLKRKLKNWKSCRGV